MDAALRAQLVDWPTAWAHHKAGTPMPRPTVPWPEPDPAFVEDFRRWQSEIKPHTVFQIEADFAQLVDDLHAIKQSNDDDDRRMALMRCPAHEDWDLWFTEVAVGVVEIECTGGCTEEAIVTGIDRCRRVRQHPWFPRSLSAAWHGEFEEPEAEVLERSDGVGVLMPGINYLFGDSGDGKSWAALCAAVQCMRAGQHVIWITYEDVNELEIVKRLRLLGVEERDLRHLSLIVATDPLTAGIQAIATGIRVRQTSLVVLDSIGEALGIEGIDEDRDAEFGPWARETLRTLLDLAAAAHAPNGDDSAPNTHVAVLAIDHSTKAKDNSLYPSGTKRKRALVTGIMLRLDVVEPFGENSVGRVKLVAAKDRSGRFRRGETVAVITMDATTVPYVVAIDPPHLVCATTTTDTHKRPAVERIMQVLAEAATNMTRAEVHASVNRSDHTLPGEVHLQLATIGNELTKLGKSAAITVEKAPTGVGGTFQNIYGNHGSRS